MRAHPPLGRTTEGICKLALAHGRRLAGVNRGAILPADAQEPAKGCDFSSGRRRFESGRFFGRPCVAYVVAPRSANPVRVLLATLRSAALPQLGENWARRARLTAGSERGKGPSAGLQRRLWHRDQKCVRASESAARSERRQSTAQEP